MDMLDEIITMFRVVIIPLGVVLRVVFCLTKMIYDEDAQGTYKKKIRNTIVFGIMAEVIFVILDLLKVYYNFAPFVKGGPRGGTSGGGFR